MSSSQDIKNLAWSMYSTVFVLRKTKAANLILKKKEKWRTDAGLLFYNFHMAYISSVPAWKTSLKWEHVFFHVQDTKEWKRWMEKLKPIWYNCYIKIILKDKPAFVIKCWKPIISRIDQIEEQTRENWRMKYICRSTYISSNKKFLQIILHFSMKKWKEHFFSFYIPFLPFPVPFFSLHFFFFIFLILCISLLSMSS